MAESAAASKSAAPRRGKFLSGPAQLPSEGSSSFPSSSSGGPQLSSTGTANTGGNDDVLHDHSMVRAYVHNIKTMATARRKVIESQRKSVLDDLDKAEDVVLALLELASGVTTALSDMTTATSSSTTKIRRHDNSELTNNVEGGREEDNNNARQLGGNSFEELARRVSAGSGGYSSGVKKLHTLLAPHAHYVKSLTNSNRLTSTAIHKNGERSPSNHYGGLMAATSSSVVSNSKDGNVFGKIIEEATSNMYAVRVKKRLIMERCEVLRQMIQLEEDDGALSETGQVKVEEEQDDKPKKKVTAASSSKRKHR